MATSFTYGSVTVTMDHDPLHPREWDESQEFASGYDSDGNAYAYDCLAPNVRSETLLFPAESWTKLMALLDFVENAILGSRRPFTWTDRLGITRTARYIQLRHRQVYVGLHAVWLTLEVLT